MVALWAILIDAPHVFGTFSRTYFDRTERRNRGRLLWGSLLFFVVGPLMVLFGAGLVFFFVAALWALLPPRKAALWLHDSLQKEE
jgi:dolichol kinase